MYSNGKATANKQVVDVWVRLQMIVHLLLVLFSHSNFAMAFKKQMRLSYSSTHPYFQRELVPDLVY
jgi:hypothetical protein